MDSPGGHVIFKRMVNSKIQDCFYFCPTSTVAERGHWVNGLDGIYSFLVMDLLLMSQFEMVKRTVALAFSCNCKIFFITKENIFFSMYLCYFPIVGMKSPILRN